MISTSLAGTSIIGPRRGASPSTVYPRQTSWHGDCHSQTASGPRRGTPLDRSCSPRGRACTSDEADRVLTKHGLSDVSRDPATDDRVRGTAHACIPADCAIDGGELLDDPHPGRPWPFLAPSTGRDQGAEEAEPGHGFHHRVCQLTRLVRMLAVTADERTQFVGTVEFLREADCGCGGG